MKNPTQTVTDALVAASEAGIDPTELALEVILHTAPGLIHPGLVARRDSGQVRVDATLERYRNTPFRVWNTPTTDTVVTFSHDDFVEINDTLPDWMAAKDTHPNDVEILAKIYAAFQEAIR